LTQKLNIIWVVKAMEIRKTHKYLLHHAVTEVPRTQTTDKL